jgi:hypothetical protein
MRRFIVLLCAVGTAALVAMPAITASARDQGCKADGDYSVKKGAIKIKDWRMLSSGGIAFFCGPQGEGDLRAARNTPSLGTNTDPNDPQQDLAGGQAETAIAASGQRLVSSWNDATGFFVGDSTDRNGGLQGVGYSSDGGATWTDLIGLPNDNPKQAWFGDPTVAAIDANHFVVGGLYLPSFFGGRRSSHLALAVSVGTVASGGGSITFGKPIIAADGGRVGDATSAFLDKELIGYDPVSRTLAMAYTSFQFDPPAHCGNGQIEMVRARVPSNPANLSRSDWSSPIVVSPEVGGDCDFANFVVQEGADVALAPGGNAFVTWERNWISNLYNGDPYAYIDAARIPAGDTSPDATLRVSQGQLNGNPAGGVKSMVLEFIAGYNRGVGNDFPRVAYNRTTDRVIFVWNDSSHHPLGDIFMRSVTPDFGTVSSIRKVNDDDSYALHFLPAVDIKADGSICTGWYDRRRFGGDSPMTDYFGECRPNAFTGTTDFRVTTGATDWTNTSSIIIPNFGDYTDAGASGNTIYYNWSDGRLGVPQPMVDHH